MRKIDKSVVVAGALAALSAVAIGAFGAHGLRAIIPVERMATFKTGVEYHFWHALGMLAIGAIAARSAHPGRLAGPAWLMLAGIVLFSGSLYLLAITGIRGFGAIAPLGGTAFIAAWAWIAIAVWRMPD